MASSKKTTGKVKEKDAPKILILDDEKSVQMAMEMALANEGYDLYFASNGKKGLEIFNKKVPELIFLDLKMPVMDGYEFLDAIKVDKDSPFTIVVITGHGDDNEVERCYKLGIDFFLKKPLNLVEICGLARRCIELKSLEKQRNSLLAELNEANEKLEKRVAERTLTLSETIDSLEEEIAEHNITTEKLNNKTKALEESNIALEVLLRRRDEEKGQYDIDLNAKIEKMIRPYLDKLKTSRLNVSQKNLVEMIDQNLNAIVSPFLYNQLSLIIKLTAKEIQVANLIKQGLTTKEIATILNISSRTVETHRYQIRKKMGLQEKGANLRKSLLKTY